jgi:ATP-dependent Clp protease ATP-binding subunit ClpC
LVGAPPGYVGYEEGGQLTEAVRRKSYSVILLDEIEKAHPDVFNMLLQVFDDGSLTDAKGRKVDFRNTIIIMTSNVGSDLIRRESALGFTVKTEESKTEEAQYKKMKDKVTEELKRVFRPEFLNRIDGQIVFHALSREHIRVVVDLELAKISPNLLIKGISMEVTDNARDWIGEKGFDPVFGARPLRRVIQNEIEDRLSEALLEGRFGPGDTVLIDVSESGEVVLTKQEAPALASST